MSETKKSRVSDGVELSFYGLIEFLPTVAMEIRPERGDTVDVFFALDIYESASLPICDNARFLLDPFLHLGKWVP
jgi:hypothetical protein